MIKQENISFSTNYSLVQKLKDYKALVKLNLSLMVVFSSVVGYLLVPGIGSNLFDLFMLFLGGMLVTAAANASNEIIERDTDKLMRRTLDRPLPSGRMQSIEALIFAALSLVAGLSILTLYFNALAGLLSFISFITYVFAYTPLKRVSPINVLVGAFPGALPALIGWAAGANNLASGAWVLFALQFLWQFPHFWSIAWLAHEDYSNAGLKMLPTKDKSGKFTALQTVLYTFALLLLSVLPKMFNVSGWLSVGLIACAGMWFLYNAFQFFKTNKDEQARKLMFASFLYLPIVYISLIIDKL